MSQQVLTITQINEHIRDLVDRDTLLSSIAVKGEISNYKVYPSGHHYFTLKDDAASLKCVMFRSHAIKIRFRPENGMKIIAMGRISVYPRDGAYQLYCTGIVLDGVGDLYAAYEQLKAKLAAEGLFAAEHKKPIPKYPGVIGIVTSSAGAAVHDMIRVLRKRYPLTQIKLLPVRVQGAEAPAEIVSAIRYANYYNLADLLIVGRGGGSIEDLWAFNDESVAYAIYNSQIPVISAVGHEPDVTISDYVADLRAATPSNAAELAVPDAESLHQMLDAMYDTLQHNVKRQVMSARRYLHTLSISPVLQSPTRYVEQHRDALKNIKLRLVAAQRNDLERKRNRFISSTAKLDAMSPLKVLTRGFAVVHADDGSVIRSVKEVSQGEKGHIQLSDGVLDVTVDQIMEGSL